MTRVRIGRISGLQRYISPPGLVLFDNKEKKRRMRQKEIIEIIPTKDIFVGDLKAPVTLMQYGDYESEACAKVNEVVDKLLKQYEGKMRFNFRHFPLTKIHQHSMKAAEASLGAAQEGKFWE